MLDTTLNPAPNDAAWASSPNSLDPSNHSSLFGDERLPFQDDSRHELARLKSGIARAAQVCRQAADGDLEPRMLHIEEELDPDLRELMARVNHLLDMTDAFVREASATLQHVSRGEFHRRLLVDGMRGGFRRAAVEINEATDAMEARSIALQEAEKSRAALATTFDAATRDVESLLSASNRIGEMSGFISKIAGQSNLLALNASIEAARAGSAGACFAIVAGEIRALSDRTADATNEIAQRVESIQDASRTVGDTIRAIWQTLHDQSPAQVPAR